VFPVYTGILSSFKNVLGHERVTAHAESDEELLHSVQKQWQVIEAATEADADARHQYLVGTSMSSASSLLSLLSEHLDEANYGILLHSVSKDSSCYTFQGTVKEALAISKAGSRFVR
jgi:hypothetical protein